MEDLYLLCTPKDLPNVTDQVITQQTWNVALTSCPELNVHLIFSCVPYYDYIKTIVNPIIPLVSFYMDSSISHLDIEHLNSWYFGCTVKMLISFFPYQLKVLSFHIWHSNERVDVSICKCITHCYRLEQFEYRGPFDKLDTIEDYVLSLLLIL
uniref:F-box only protein 39 n=1 Tax=Triatoma infestans TaxID=30076 RepID=A0A161MCE4_TRIIF